MNPTAHPTIGFDSTVRTLSIIVAAMLLGVIALAVITALVPLPDGMGGAGGTPVLSYVAGAVGLLALATGPLLGTVITTAGRRRLEAASNTKRDPTASPATTSPSAETTMIQTYLAKTIVTAAVFEGGALLAFIAQWIEQTRWPAAVGVVLALVLALQFPTRDRARRWVDRQMRPIH